MIAARIKRLESRLLPRKVLLPWFHWLRSSREPQETPPHGWNMKDFPFNIPSEILFGDLGAMSPDSPVVEVNERAALEKGEIPEYWTEPYEPEEAARREKLLREYGLTI